VGVRLGLGGGHGGGEDLEVWARGDVCGGEGAMWSKPGKGRRMEWAMATEANFVRAGGIQNIRDYVSYILI
jgi:hypothetical protein